MADLGEGVTRPTGVEVMPDVWRATLVDVNNMAEFLLTRLREKYEGAGDRAIMGLLQSALVSNEYHFLRTTHAFGLAGVRREPLEKPIVLVMFCVTVDEDHDLDAAVLFDAFGRWANGMGIDRMEIDVFTDVGKAGIERYLGEMKYQKRYVINGPFGPRAKR